MGESINAMRPCGSIEEATYIAAASTDECSSTTRGQEVVSSSNGTGRWQHRQHAQLEDPT